MGSATAICRYRRRERPGSRVWRESVGASRSNLTVLEVLLTMAEPQERVGQIIMATGSQNQASNSLTTEGTHRQAERPMTMEGISTAGVDEQASCDEAALIRRCQDGDLAAYDPLVRRYQDRVFNVCWRMCGHRAEAEDLTQEAFVRAMESIGRFDGRAKFYTWLFRIAVNVVISARRKSKRASTFSIDTPNSRDGDELSSSGGRLVSEVDPPEARAMDREREHIVLEALASLDEEHRCVVTLRDLESFGYDEIADILEVPIGTVKSRLHRARLALREKLAPVLETA